MQIQLLDINTIDIDTRFRVDPAEDINELMFSIEKFGLIQPIVVCQSEKGPKLICGRRRLEAHFRLEKQNPKFTLIPAVFKETLSEHEQRIVELEENIRRVDFTDLEKVKAVIEIDRLMKLQTPGWTQEQTAKYIGYTPQHTGRLIAIARAIEKEPEGEIAKITEKEGATAGFKAVLKEKENQGFALLNALIKEKAKVAREEGKPDTSEERASQIITLGDSLQLIRLIPDGSVYLIHTDPPYGIDFDILEKGATKREMYSNDTIEESTRIWEDLSKELFRVASPDSYAVVWVSFVQMNMIRDFMTKAGFECARTPFVWIKQDPDGTRGAWAAYAPTVWFASACDFALIFRKGNPTLRQQGKPNFSLCSPISPSEKTHPLERPILLLSELIGRFIIPGQTVFDPFAGSGSTLIATLCLKGNPIGFEKDEVFFNKAKMNVVNWLKENQNK